MANEPKILKISTLQASRKLVNDTGQPDQAFLRDYNNNLQNTKVIVDGLNVTVVDIQDLLVKLEAAVIRLGAAELAIESTTDETAKQARQLAILNSYTDPDITSIIHYTIVATSGRVQVTIDPHTRHYSDPDKTVVSVQGGVINNLLTNTYYYLYYQDAMLAGGAVTYQATTNYNTAYQSGTTHYMGYINVTTTTASDGTVTSSGTAGGGSTGRGNSKNQIQ